MADFFLGENDKLSFSVVNVGVNGSSTPGDVGVGYSLSSPAEGRTCFILMPSRVWDESSNGWIGSFGSINFISLSIGF